MQKNMSRSTGSSWSCLTSFSELLGDEPITLKEYCELLDAGFEEAKVGVIPPSIDQVVIGDVERTRMKDIRALFFCRSERCAFCRAMRGTGGNFV